MFEHLSFNLYELLKRTHFRGVSITLLRKFGRQILKSLAFLALPEVDIIHWWVVVVGWGMSPHYRRGVPPLTPLPPPPFQ